MPSHSYEKWALATQAINGYVEDNVDINIDHGPNNLYHMNDFLEQYYRWFEIEKMKSQ